MFGTIFRVHPTRSFLVGNIRRQGWSSRRFFSQSIVLNNIKRSDGKDDQKAQKSKECFELERRPLSTGVETTPKKKSWGFWTKATSFFDKISVDKRVWPIALSTLLTGTAIGVIFPVMPLFASELGLSKTDYGLVVAAMGFARLFSNFAFAYVGEKFGRKILLVSGPAVSSLSFFGTAVARTFEGMD